MITVDQARQLQVGDILVLRADRSLHIPNWNIRFSDGQEVKIIKLMDAATGVATPAAIVRHMNYTYGNVNLIDLICQYVDTGGFVVTVTGNLAGHKITYPLSIIDQVIKANQPKPVAELTGCYTGLFDTNANRTLNDAII